MGRESLGFAATFLAVAALGGGMIYLGVQGCLVIKQQKTWPAVEGVVLESKFITNTDFEPELQVACEYTVAGTTYRRTAYTQQFESDDSIPEGYRAGDRVRLYYDPEDPDWVLLEYGSQSGNIAWIAGGAFLVLFCGGFLVLNLASDVLFFIGRRKADRALSEMKAAVFDMEEAMAEMQAARETPDSDERLGDVVEGMAERIDDTRDLVQQWEEEFDDGEECK